MEKNFKFNVGDKVVVLLDGFQCPRYDTFFAENDAEVLVEKFTEGADVPVNVIGTVVVRGIGTGTGDCTYGIEIQDKVYVVGELGVFGAMEEVSQETLDANYKQGKKESSERMFKELGNSPMGKMLMLMAMLGINPDDED